MFRKTDNDLWLGLEYEHGNDSAPILTPQKSSFICPTTCPTGVTDASLSFTNTLGGRPVAGAPVETVKNFNTYSWRAEWAVADRGPHSWVAMVQGNGTKQDYRSGASAERSLAGVYLRYFYMRTYGFYASYAHDFKYKYTRNGTTADFGHNNNKNITLLWNPAMNVSFHLVFNPSSTNAVFSEASLLPPGTTIPNSNKTSSWSFGMEYSF